MTERKSAIRLKLGDMEEGGLGEARLIGGSKRERKERKKKGHIRWGSNV